MDGKLDPSWVRGQSQGVVQWYLMSGRQVGGREGVSWLRWTLVTVGSRAGLGRSGGVQSQLDPLAVIDDGQGSCLGSPDSTIRNPIPAPQPSKRASPILP